MDKEETWALFLKGKDAWNAWAEEMLAKRKALEEAGEWAVNNRGKGQNEVTRNWLAAAAVSFEGRKFSAAELPGGADFNRLVFPGDAVFEGVKFQRTAKFRETEFHGAARFEQARFRGDAGFREAKFNGTARFAGTTFQRNVGFRNVKFEDAAWFERAWFHRDASFRGATFHGTAWFAKARFQEQATFRQVRFERDAWFEEAEFEGQTRFVGSEFERDARFQGGRFFRDARFSQATFKGYTTFERVQFDGLSNFGAIEVKRAFSLAGTTFLQVPDFIQANFAQSPRLDNLEVRASEARLQSNNDRTTQLEAKSDVEAKWRTLKRLAIQAHDHARELGFFAGELKASRGLGSWRQAGILIVSFPYEWLSDFGRSICRPLFWLVVTLAVFYGAYLSNHSAFVEREQWGAVWTWGKLTSYFDDREIPVDACEVGSEDSNAFRAAIALSWRNAIPVAGLGAPEKLNQVYRCLYGVTVKTEGLQEPAIARLPPRIPDRIAFYGVLQTLISAVLLFLFLLAVRNHFRIK